MKRAAACLAALAALGLAGAASAQLKLIRQTVDGGGGRVTGGPYAVTATIGQADASRAMTSARYVVAGGFWPELRGDALFRDGFEEP